MESNTSLEQSILVKLQQAIVWAITKQQQITAEVLTIQKAINKIQSTKPMQIKQYQEEIQQKIEETIIKPNQHHKKIEQMLSKADEQLKNLNPSTKAKNVPQKRVQPLPTIQKKPPIPTSNRSKDAILQSNFPKPNMYRKKNQITPKVTQTPYMSSKKVSGQQQGLRQTQSLSKNTIQSGSRTSIQKSEQNKETHSNEKKINTDKQPNNKLVKYNFQSFGKSPAELLQSKQRNKISSRRHIIQKLIQQNEKEEMGHRQNHKKYLDSFLNTFNKISIIKKNIQNVKEPNDYITDTNWDGSPETLQFPKLLERFKTLISENPITQQYRMQPRICQQIKAWHCLLNIIFEKNIQPARSSLQVPSKIGFDFHMKDKPDYCHLKVGYQGQQNKDFYNQHQEQLYSLFQQMLEQLKNLSSFDKKALSRIRILICIVLYEGRRNPTIIEKSKFQDWKNYYLNEEN